MNLLMILFKLMFKIYIKFYSFSLITIIKKELKNRLQKLINSILSIYPNFRILIN